MVSSEGRSWINSTLAPGTTFALTALIASVGLSVATIQISKVRPSRRGRPGPLYPNEKCLCHALKYGTVAGIGKPGVKPQSLPVTIKLPHYPQIQWLVGPDRDE